MPAKLLKIHLLLEKKSDNADSAATTGVDAEQSKNPEAADHAEENADVAAVEENANSYTGS